MAQLPLAFLCGHRKSGTTLLSNLLDGHPQLALYPVDLVLLYAYFPEFIRTHTDGGERRRRLKTVLFDDLRQRRVAGLDIEALEHRFFTGLTDSELADPAALISRLMRAFTQTRQGGEQPLRWGVFKETSIEIYTGEILQWFPTAKFVHLLRDPRDNYAALAEGVERYYSRMGEDRSRTLASLLNRVRTGFRMARSNRAAFGAERYHLLRFEDLTTTPEVCMHAVADFLGIAFDDSMLVPTTLGSPAGGNAFDGVAVFDVNTRNVGRWRDRISDDEAQVIEFHLADEMRLFGYEPVFSELEQARAAAEFYKWQNYAYFYSDRFAHGLAR